VWKVRLIEYLASDGSYNCGVNIFFISQLPEAYFSKFFSFFALFLGTRGGFVDEEYVIYRADDSS